MSGKQFNKKLDQQLKEISDPKFMFFVVSDTHAKQVKRIFTNGIKTDGSKIGTYSTKPMLASEKQFVKSGAFKQSYIDPDSGAVVDSQMEGDVPFFLTFTNPKTKVKNKKATPIMFLGGGYKEFKQIQGRESGFVNLRLTNRLQSDFTNSLQRQGATYITGVKFKENEGKVLGAFDKYGNIFGLTKEERKFFNSEVTKILIKKLNDD